MLSVKDLTIDYDGKIIIDGFFHDFEEGFTAISGESGRGKTTLLRALAGLKEYTGDIILDNKEIRPGDIFMMHQHHSNFDWLTVKDNILFPVKMNNKLNDSAYKKADEILKLIGLEEHKFKYPKELSGGQQQRLALGRLLITSPKVILMDEPFSALDKTTKKNILDILKDYQEEHKNIIIFVSHSSDEINYLTENIIYI